MFPCTNDKEFTFGKASLCSGFCRLLYFNFLSNKSKAKNQVYGVTFDLVVVNIIYFKRF